MDHYNRIEKGMAIDAKTGNEVEVVLTSEAFSHCTCDVCDARVSEWVAPSTYSGGYEKILIKRYEVRTTDAGFLDRTTWEFDICEKCINGRINIAALKKKIPGKYHYSG